MAVLWGRGSLVFERITLEYADPDVGPVGWEWDYPGLYWDTRLSWYWYDIERRPPTRLLGFGRHTSPPQRANYPVSVAVAVWGLGYALYRSYYALGGTLLLPGTPADPAQFRLINAAAVVILAIAAVLPIAMLPLWQKTASSAGAACGVLGDRRGLHHARSDRQHRAGP